jgi:hypothetical protein
MQIVCPTSTPHYQIHYPYVCELNLTNAIDLNNNCNL